MSDLQKVMALFGDMPKDSKCGAALRAVMAAAVLEARTNTTFGRALKAMVDAGRDPSDTMYSKMPPQDAVAVQSLLNGLKVVL